MQRPLIVESDANSDDDIYTVERIVDKKRVGQKTHYLVKWEGYTSD